MPEKSDEQQISDQAIRLEKLIDHWCPENLRYEGYPVTLLRAFMAATACCADQKRVLDGKQPIRPLDSFPDPMQGFFNTPTGFQSESNQTPPPAPPGVSAADFTHELHEGIVAVLEGKELIESTIEEVQWSPTVLPTSIMLTLATGAKFQLNIVPICLNG